MRLMNEDILSSYEQEYKATQEEIHHTIITKKLGYLGIVFGVIGEIGGFLLDNPGMMYINGIALTVAAGAVHLSNKRINTHEQIIDDMRVLSQLEQEF